MEDEKRKIKTPPNKQLIMNIGKTKYTVNLHSSKEQAKHIRIKY